MSSTNRSASRDAHISDYYVTPINKIKEFLEAFNKDCDIFSTCPIILDPCAGGDTKNPMSYPQAIIETFNSIHANDIITLDIREDSLAEEKCDYLTKEISYKPKVIITNPPFSLALPIIEKALNDVADDGYVVMLLRLNFFGTKDRFPFFNKYMPKWCYVHHRRIGFVKGGKTDSIEYMHAVWHKGENPDYCMLKVI